MQESIAVMLSMLLFVVFILLLITLLLLSLLLCLYVTLLMHIGSTTTKQMTAVHNLNTTTANDNDEISTSQITITYYSCMPYS
jgi:hypothetical protein